MSSTGPLEADGRLRRRAHQWARSVARTRAAPLPNDVARSIPGAV